MSPENGSNMEIEEITKRLDALISVLRLVHSDAIEAASARIRKDDANDELLDATEADFVAAGTLKTMVAKATGESERTVTRRIADLVAMGTLEKRGAGPATAYRATGLI